MILGIDPGNKGTAFCMIDEEDGCRPVDFLKESNEYLEDGFKSMAYRFRYVKKQKLEVAIEMVASYGMPVGAEVFDTCVWIGRYIEIFKHFGYEPILIYRKDEKMALCNSMKANDATIKQALVDRFAAGVPNHGKGSKKEPGFFYGFKADVWAAFAVAVTCADKLKGEANE